MIPLSRRQFIGLASVSALLGISGAGIIASRPLRFSVHIRTDVPWMLEKGNAVIAGVKRHGHIAYLSDYRKPTDDADISVIHSWGQKQIIQHTKRLNRRLLVMEAGFFQPRFEWCSLAWDGLNGLGFVPSSRDSGARFEKYFGHLLKPWRYDQEGYALLIGQVPWDPAIYGLNMNQWIADMAQQLLARGWSVLYRPHPKHVELLRRRGEMLSVPAGTTLSSGSLAEDLDGAAACFTYSSNASVEAVMTGVPTVTMHEGAITWPVTSHNIDQPFYYPDRTLWCHDMAWRHWRISEISDGGAWSHMSRALPIYLR